MKEMKKPKGKSQQKKPYTRPTLTPIDLAADEVMVQNCKTTYVTSGKFGACDGVNSGTSACWKLGS